MTKGVFRGNKGEWSEPYVVLRLLADGRLCQADRDMLPSDTEYARILEVVRGDTRATLDGRGGVVFAYTDLDGQCHTVQTNQVNMLKRASQLFRSISSAKSPKGAFELPVEASELKRFGFKQLKNPSSLKRQTAKRDLGLIVDSPALGYHQCLGFSIKSGIGAPPTLLNASHATNILYRVKGLTPRQAESINGISGPRKIMARCRAIKNWATSIEHEAFEKSTFADNLDIVDSALPLMISDLVKAHYFDQILLTKQDGERLGSFRESDKLSKAVELLSLKEPYCSRTRKNYCEIKIKRFLRACALGFLPTEVWEGKEDASGGYIVVLPDGRLVALYVYNTNLFEKYLYESTIFERASTTRHEYMELMPDGKTGDYLLKLNLQIRFNR